jgi:hypothetical protein
MAELLVRVQAIDSAVKEIMNIVTGSRFSNPRKDAGGIQDNTPPWADKITRMLAQVSADVQEVKREIHSRSFDSGHGKNGDEVAPEIGLPSSSREVDRYEHQPESSTAPAREPSQTVDGPGVLSQPAGEEPATEQNTLASPPSTDLILSPRPNAESPIHHGRDSSEDTSRSCGPSTPESRSSDNSITTSPPSIESSISETALSKDVNAEESTERPSQHEPASTVPFRDDTGLCNAPTVRCMFVDVFNHDEETFDQICRDKRAQDLGRW